MSTGDDGERAHVKDLEAYRDAAQRLAKSDPVVAELDLTACGRGVLLDLVRDLRLRVAQLQRDDLGYLKNLTAVQTRCTELLEETRELKARIVSGRSAHNDDRIARDELARMKDAAEKRAAEAEAIMMTVIAAKDAHHAALLTAASAVLDQAALPMSPRGRELAAIELIALSRAVCDLKEDDDLPPPTAAETHEEIHNP